MSSSKRRFVVALVSAIAVAGSAAADPAAPPPRPDAPLTSIDLTGPFGTRSPWRLTAVQGPAIADPTGAGMGETVPGVVALCLRKGDSGPCDPQLRQRLDDRPGDDVYAEPHFLDAVRIVRRPGAGGRPLLLIETASVHGGNSDQLVLTQALAYDAAADRFVRAYDHMTGRNNNQQVRYLDVGPLAGDFVSVEPTTDAPFGFWVAVQAPASALAYSQMLRFRSATRYGDGNPLPVIDSEMPNILSRLGLWRPGSPLPRPADGCPRPRLVRQALWCG